MMTCHIALGGNVGQVATTFEAALATLAADPRIEIVRVSSVHRSRAGGAAAGDDFRNAAAELRTDHPPLELLDRLLATETRFGRTRERHWGPRTLDLDLLLWGDLQLREPRLRIPHPACWYRRFVLDPLVEIAPHVVHPERGATIAELRRRLLPRPLRVEVCGGATERRSAIAGMLSREFPSAAVREWPRDAGTPESRPAILAWLGDDELAYDELPRQCRLDASGAAPEPFLRHALQAALGA